MKKVIAIALSLLLIISLLPMAAFAGEKSDEVYAKMTAARDFLYGQKAAFTAAESYDFALYLAADGDGEAFKDAYIQSVKDAFDAGSMTTADRVALAAICLDALGENVEEFTLNDGSKVNLLDEMKSKGTEADSPYNYFFVLAMSDDDAYTEAVLTALKNDYTMGSGYNYWGFGTDNTANFGAIMAEYADDADAYLEDADAVLDGAKVEKGYYYTADYGTDANGNSTASVLFYYAVAGNQDKADESYALLTDNFDLGDGSYHYMNDGANNYATRDALKALIYYDRLLDTKTAGEEPTGEENYTDSEAADDAAEATGVTQSTPATGDSLAAVAVAGSAVLALGLALALRKKEEA